MNIKSRGIFLVLLMLAMLAGCTDTSVARMTAYGDPAHITCYSGGKVIYEGYSTGKVERAEEGADGYRFKDAHTKRYREVSGDCDVDYGKSVASTN